MHLSKKKRNKEPSWGKPNNKNHTRLARSLASPFGFYQQFNYVEHMLFIYLF